MPDTTARGIQFPVEGDQGTPLNEKFEQLAETADAAIDDALASLGLQWRALRNDGFSHNSTGNWQNVTNWQPVDGDPGDAVGITYSTGVLTVSADGLYLANLTLAFDDDPDGTRGARFLRTGATAIGARAGWLGRVSATESGTGWVLAALSAGDTLTIQGFQSSGGNLALEISESQMNRVAIVRLGVAL
ncbi:MAG TPA: hypothetical protein VF062_26870 [Candidatus Limnocylindrales bacterium]